MGKAATKLVERGLPGYGTQQISMMREQIKVNGLDTFFGNPRSGGAAIEMRVDDIETASVLALYRAMGLTDSDLNDRFTTDFYREDCATEKINGWYTREWSITKQHRDWIPEGMKIRMGHRAFVKVSKNTATNGESPKHGNNRANKAYRQWTEYHVELRIQNFMVAEGIRTVEERDIISDRDPWTEIVNVHADHLQLSEVLPAIKGMLETAVKTSPYALDNNKWYEETTHDQQQIMRVYLSDQIHQGKTEMDQIADAVKTAQRMLGELPGMTQKELAKQLLAKVASGPMSCELSDAERELLKTLL